MSGRPARVYYDKRTGVRIIRKAKTAKQRQKATIRRMINNVQENKYWPVYAGYATVNASGAITKWSAISQGDTASTRDGQDIMFKSIDLRFNIFPTSAAVMTGNAFRIIVFQWKPDDNVSVPGMSDILESSFTQPVFSPIRVQTKQLFRVMYDRLFRVYNGGPGAAGRTVRITGKRMVRRIRYNAGVTTTGTNQIYVLVISDAAVQTPSWSYGAYLRYSDS